MRNKFTEIFGTTPDSVYFAPGRVNLIGEHTDYNGGHVFPCALSLGTYGCIAKREDSLLRFYSANFEEDGILTVDLKELSPGRTSSWTAYPEGVFWTMCKEGWQIPFGADLLFWGNLPAGSGLSSSASLEVLTALMIKEEYGLEPLSLQQIAVLSQYSENHYNGMQCGIMDQFSSAMGKKDHAIFLDTNTLAYQFVPLILKDATIVITNSKVKHSLVSSAYNDRKKECSRALQYFRQTKVLQNLNGLCEMTCEQFEKYADLLPDEILKKRARHAVYENARAKEAVSALQANDLNRFGKLMNESHISLRDDYEVSCEEIDYLTELAWSAEGVVGSRITGGGFGGCTVSIVKKDCIEDFKKHISKQYRKRYGLEPLFYVDSPEDGAHAIYCN